MCSLFQVNQLEKDKDVVAQAQAIAMLEALPQQSFSIINALNNFLTDTKVLFCFPLIIPHSLYTLLCSMNLKFFILLSRLSGESGLRRHSHWLWLLLRYFVCPLLFASKLECFFFFKLRQNSCLLRLNIKACFKGPISILLCPVCLVFQVKFPFCGRKSVSVNFL